MYPTLVLLSLFALSQGALQLVNVTTSRGTLSGYHFDQGNNKSALFYGQADIFLGVPFAQPPVGVLRFAKTQRLDKFPYEPYDATQNGLICPQPGQRDNPNVMNEDCLYLNIFTPNAKSTTKYPVMVWIHGGGLVEGSAIPSIPGTVRNLVNRGVVIVLIQYRLGALGFFTTFTDEFPANLGMLDQVMALKFVQEEISNFGGDPARVTIFGESAGAHSVSAHTFSPLSQDLFAQSIHESGTAYLCYDNYLGPTNKNFAVASRGCGTTFDQWNARNFTALKECLWNMDVDQLVGVQSGASGRTFNSLCYNMVQDNNFFPGVPRDLYKTRKAKPAIIGTNKDEYGLFEIIFIMNGGAKIDNYTQAFAKWRLTEVFGPFVGSKVDQVFETLLQQYFGNNIPNDTEHVEWINFISTFGTAFFFTGPVGRDVSFYMKQTNPNLFLYEFTYYSKADQHTTVPGWKPVTHGVETPFLFMGWGANDLANGQITLADVAIADFLGESWTNFAKTGKPTTDNSWKAVTTDGNNTEYYEIGNTSGPKTGYRTTDRIVTNQILPQILGTFPPDLPDNNNGSDLLCPFTWQKSIVNPKKCFGVYNDTKTQTDVGSYCFLYNARMKSIDNAFENRQLQTYVQATTPNCDKSWIGYYKHGRGWIWNNGDQNNTYTNWETGYPIDNTDICVSFNTNDGKWENHNCNNTYCFVCESLWK